VLQPLEVLSLYPPHDGTLASLLRSRASVAPEREFIVFGDRAWTYSGVVAEVERAAALLRGLGVEHGDRVAAMSINDPTTVFALFALAEIGAILVPLNADHRVDEARYVLEHAQVGGIICSEQALPVARAASAAMRPAPWLMGNGAAAAPFGELRSFDDSPAAMPEAKAAAAAADDVCVLIYTSGTTGFPKGVMHTQRTIALCGEAFVERVHLQPDDRALCVLPMFHINAIGYSLAGTLAAGATLILERKFSASQFWRIVKASGATQANALAAITSILMRRPKSEFAAGHRLRMIYGAPLSAETIRTFQQDYHVPVLIEGYGMSEIPGVLSNPYAGPRKPGSMGMPCRHPDPALRLSEVRIVDDDGTPLADGEIGEIAVRTPLVMQGYFRDPEQTARAFRDGWFLTGDLGRRDADGFYWFVARKKDIIRKRGENISGAELDRVIGEHPSVLEAAAIAVPAELGDDDILVAIVVKPGATLTGADVAAWCRERLAPIKTPRYVWFAAALPHTPTHRVAKFKLRQLGDLRDRAIDLEKR